MSAVSNRGHHVGIGGGIDLSGRDLFGNLAGSTHQLVTCAVIERDHEISAVLPAVRLSASVSSLQMSRLQVRARR